LILFQENRRILEKKSLFSCPFELLQARDIVDEDFGKNITDVLEITTSGKYHRQSLFDFGDIPFQGIETGDMVLQIIKQRLMDMLERISPEFVMRQLGISFPKIHEAIGIPASLNMMQDEGVFLFLEVLQLEFHKGIDQGINQSEITGIHIIPSYQVYLEASFPKR